MPDQYCPWGSHTFIVITEPTSERGNVVCQTCGFDRSTILHTYIGEMQEAIVGLGLRRGAMGPVPKEVRDALSELDRFTPPGVELPDLPDEVGGPGGPGGGPP